MGLSGRGKKGLFCGNMDGEVSGMPSTSKELDEGRSVSFKGGGPP